MFMKLMQQIDSNARDQQRIYRLMSALASSGCLPEGSWLEWFQTDAQQPLGKNLIALLAKMRRYQSQSFQTPAPHERLEKVRALMQAEQLDALLVGHDDENLCEYVAPGGERLQWLTGFRGSAGMLLLGHEAAVLFVDGRYQLQAPQQVDTEFISVKPLSENSLLEEIDRLSAQSTTGFTAAQALEVTTKGWRIGLDTRLFSAQYYRRLSRQCQERGHRLCALEDNPIDRVWHHQPPPPISPVEFVAPSLHGQSSASKLEALLPVLSSKKADCLVLQAPGDIAWLLNVRAWDIATAPLCLSRLIVHAEGSIDWFVSPERCDNLRAQTLSSEIYIHPMTDYPEALVMLGKAAQSVWVDPARVSAWVIDTLQQSGAKLIENEDPVAALSSRLNATEIAAMHQAHLWDGAAMVQFMVGLTHDPKPMSESALAKRLHQTRREQPTFLQDSFEAIVAARGHSAICHYRPEPGHDAEVRWGDIVLIDSGGHYVGGTTDVTRVIAYDQAHVPLDATFCQHYTMVLKSLIAVSCARFPAGTTGAALDAIARQILWQHGLDYDHGTGHGVGANLMVHFGRQGLTKKSLVALQPGMVVSLEPGVYFAERYGIRLENLAVVVEDTSLQPPYEQQGQTFYRFDNLTWVPFVQRMIDRSLLSHAELVWLNDYHAKVYRYLAPLLSPQDAQWLGQQTALLQ